MLLAITPFAEFTQLIQVLLLIILPVLILSVVTTVWLHYKRKRDADKILLDESMYSHIAGSSPESFCYNTADGKLIYLDHTGLLREYRNKLSYSHARYAALQQDMKKLETRINGSVYDSTLSSNQLKSADMENAVPPMTPPPIQRAEETEVLNSPVKENEYLTDLLDEKKKQIDFLQNQIEQRVKHFHFAEKEREELRQKLNESEQVRQKTEEEFGLVRSEQLNEIDKLTALLGENQQKLTELEQALANKQDHILYIENLLQELKGQNEMLNAAAADAEDRNKLLQQELREEEVKAAVMEGKLVANRKMLQKLYSEFSNCLQDDMDLRPVIQLRPDYLKSEWSDQSALEEETVVQ